MNAIELFIQVFLYEMLNGRTNENSDIAALYNTLEEQAFESYPDADALGNEGFYLRADFDDVFYNTVVSNVRGEIERHGEFTCGITQASSDLDRLFRSAIVDAWRKLRY